jgi:hypothetical protein
MKDPELIAVEELVEITLQTAATGFIDSVSNLANHAVWLYSGTNDTVVVPGVVHKTLEYYKLFVNNIKTRFDVPSGHAWVNNNFGSECSFNGEPYINNCGKSLVEEFLQHILFHPNNISGVKSTNQANGTLIEFDSSMYSYLAPTGFLYVPQACQQGRTCHLHVALHGCLQNEEYTKQIFFYKTGLNEAADANNMIILYPLFEFEWYVQVNSIFEFFSQVT